MKNDCPICALRAAWRKWRASRPAEVERRRGEARTKRKAAALRRRIDEANRAAVIAHEFLRGREFGLARGASRAKRTISR